MALGSRFAAVVRLFFGELRQIENQNIRDSTPDW